MQAQQKKFQEQEQKWLLEAVKAYIGATKFRKYDRMDEVLFRLAFLLTSVKKEDQAREFYCGKLGLKEIPKPDALKDRGGFWLEVGDRQIHIGVEDGVDPSVSKAHFAYLVDDIEYHIAHGANWRYTVHAIGSGAEGECVATRCRAVDGVLLEPDRRPTMLTGLKSLAAAKALCESWDQAVVIV
jgi:catechol 2,3-dioxygenase-like lactoylglutathione lyase family enzyme